MPAPEGNQNAAKPDDGATSFLYVRAKPGDKGRWTRAANRRAARERTRDARGNLAGWVTDQLNKAADDELNK